MRTPWGYLHIPYAGSPCKNAGPLTRLPNCSTEGRKFFVQEICEVKVQGVRLLWRWTQREKNLSLRGRSVCLPKKGVVGQVVAGTVNAFHEAVEQGGYRGRILELSPKNLARYAAISEATFCKSLTFRPRISWITCRRPTTNALRSAPERPSGMSPIWTRILSSARLEACVSSRAVEIVAQKVKL